MMAMEGKEWYNNKELFEMLQQIKQDMVLLSKEMAETRAIIRNYNNLREKLEDTAGKVNTLMWLMPVAIAGMGLIFTILGYLRR
jgi:prefoldin subunit 5